MFHHKCPQNHLLMFFSSLFIENRGGSVVHGGLTPSFSTNYYKMYPTLSKMVQNLIKAPNLAHSCSMNSNYSNYSNYSVKAFTTLLKNNASPKLSTKHFINAFSSLFNWNRGGSIVRFVSPKYYNKYAKLSKMV